MLEHINCGTLSVTGFPPVVCHCLLFQDSRGLILVDAGIGLADVRDPVGRFGQPLIDIAGFQFHENDTAVRRIEALGLHPSDVHTIVLTHGDPDHAGGLVDFPKAEVFVSDEELARIRSGHPRYLACHFNGSIRWQPLGRSSADWFGLEARCVPTAGDQQVLLIPLPGHTLGHCGVAISDGDRWLLHVGDAYYLRAELTIEDHPVTALARVRADSDEQRIRSLNELRRLVRDHTDVIDFTGYHDITELPDPTRIGASK